MTAESRKLIKRQRKPVPLSIDMGRCKPASSLLPHGTLSPIRKARHSKQSLVRTHTPLSPDSDDSKPLRSTPVPQTPEVDATLDSPVVPPMSRFRGGLGLRRVYYPSETVETEALLSPDGDNSSQRSQMSGCDSSFSLPRNLMAGLKRTCALCLDNEMLAMNGVELRCSHFVHRVCLRELENALGQTKPVCAMCGQDCIPLSGCSARTRRPTSSLYSTLQNPKEEAAATARSSANKDGLNCSHGDVEPIGLRSFVHPSGPESFELFIQVWAERSLLQSQWRHTRSIEEQAVAQQLTTEAICACQLGNVPIKAENLGSLRIVSNFVDANSNQQVSVSLFQKYVVISECSVAGFSDLVAMYDLEDEGTQISRSASGGLNFFNCNNTPKSHMLYAEQAVVSTWLAAVNNLSLSFPVTSDFDTFEGLSAPLNPGYASLGSLDCILCMPVACTAKLIPKVLEKMGPQDRLGIVVVTSDGSCAWVAPHKPSWPGWLDVINIEFESCDLFTLATRSLLDTATSILGDKHIGKQQTIIVVSGCPLVSAAAPQNITVHAVGLRDEYDFDLMKILVENSANGRFFHAENMEQLVACCTGVVSADRTYVHHDAELTIKVPKTFKVLGSNPPLNTTKKDTADTSDMNSEFSIIKLPLSSFVSGQSSAISIEIQAPDLRNGGLLAKYHLNSRSAVTDEPRTSQGEGLLDEMLLAASAFVAKPIFFDRLALISIDILKECYLMSAKCNTQDLQNLLERAAQKIYNAAATASTMKLSRKDLQRVLRLSDFEPYNEEVLIKSQFLAAALNDLSYRVQRYGGIHAQALLFEATQVLSRQCAYTGKSLLERIFHECLDCNRI